MFMHGNYFGVKFALNNIIGALEIMVCCARIIVFFFFQRQQSGMPQRSLKTTIPIKKKLGGSQTKPS